jgi:AcrR family transcriptional regulator
VRRRLILEAARRCIAARGLEGTTIREIAKEADISIGTITYHFSGVQDILAEALREASENFTKRFLEEADSQTGTRNRLRYIVDVNLPVDDERRSLWRLWLELWARASRDPALAEVHSERHAYERVAIAAIVDDAVERGEVRPVDSTAFALNFPRPPRRTRPPGPHRRHGRRSGDRSRRAVLDDRREPRLARPRGCGCKVQRPRSSLMSASAAASRSSHWFTGTTSTASTTGPG